MSSSSNANLAEASTKSMEVEIITPDSSKTEQDHSGSYEKANSKDNSIDPSISKKGEDGKPERGIDDSELEYGRRWYIV